MTQTILFDFGKVLGSETNVLAIDNEVSKRTGLSTQSLLNIFDAYWNQLKIGAKDLDEYHKAIVENAKNPITLDELNALHKEKIWIDNQMLNLVKNIKQQGHRVMILSNESKQGMEYKKNKFSLLDLFEKVYNSAEIGIAKPDKGIFEYVIKDLHIQPESIIFIDDWDENVLTAKSFGIQSIQYQNIDQLKKELEL